MPHKNPVGRWNDVTIQQKFIRDVLESLGPNKWKAMDKSYPVKDAIKESLKRNIPKASLRTGYDWWDHYKQYGQVPAITRYRKKKQYKTRMPQQHIDVLREIVEQHPDFYLDEIREEMKLRTQTTYSDPTIWRVLKNVLNYSLQVVIDQASKRDEEQRQDYLNAIRDTIILPNMVVFIDETAKDRNSARRRRHWSPKSKTPIRSSNFLGDRGKRYSLLSACDVNGFIVESCELVERESSNSTDPTKGTIDRDRFKLWVEEYLLPVLGDYNKLDPRSVVVMDNASIHHSDEIVQLIESKGCFCHCTMTNQLPNLLRPGIHGDTQRCHQT